MPRGIPKKRKLTFEKIHFFVVYPGNEDHEDPYLVPFDDADKGADLSHMASRLKGAEDEEYESFRTALYTWMKTAEPGDMLLLPNSYTILASIKAQPFQICGTKRTETYENRLLRLPSGVVDDDEDDPRPRKKKAAKPLKKARRVFDEDSIGDDDDE